MEQTRPSIVDIQGLGFAYGEAMVLHDLTMAVGPREVFAIVGPNAAGKTTLLRCVERVLTPRTGTIRIDGHDLKSLSARDVSRRAASVPQSHACLLYTSDAADDLLCVDLGGRRIITKKSTT